MTKLNPELYMLPIEIGTILYQKTSDEDKRGYIKYNSTYYFAAELRITLMQLNQLYSWETFNQSEVK